MRTYKPRELLDGYKISPTLFTGKKLVALVDHIAREGRTIEYRGELMTVVGEAHKVFETGPYSDKFGRGGQYYLWYYEWKPESGQSQLGL